MVSSVPIVSLVALVPIISAFVGKVPSSSAFEAVHIFLANGDLIGSCQPDSAVVGMVTHLVAFSAHLWASTGVVAPTAITHRYGVSDSIPVLVVGLIDLASVVPSVVKVVAVLPIVVGAEVVASIVVVVVVAGTFLPFSLVSSSN